MIPSGFATLQASRPRPAASSERHLRSWVDAGEPDGCSPGAGYSFERRQEREWARDGGGDYQPPPLVMKSVRKRSFSVVGLRFTVRRMARLTKGIAVNE